MPVLFLFKYIMEIPMSEPVTTVTSDQITKAVDDILKVMPDYSKLLDLNKKIFIAQEDSRQKTTTEPISIRENVLKSKIQEQFPLINIEEFKINIEAAGRLFSEICRIVKDDDSELSEPAVLLMQAVDDGKVDFELLFKAFLNEDESYFDTASSELQIGKEILAYFVYNSAKPSLNVCASGLSVHLDKNTEWHRGGCPICGSPPALSLFEEDGKRFFCCSFCWHKWRTRRIFCYNCENTDHETLHYYTFEGSEGYRVDVCDKCKKYIKTIDCRVLGRFVYPPLEYISTQHLDLGIREKGFKEPLE